MKKATLRLGSIAACFALATTAIHAQERVHALSGTVTAINSKISMIEIETDDGSPSHFRWAKTAAAIEFDKTVSADSTAADKFTSKGHHVIVYYYGQDTVRTIVSLHDLGDGSVVKSMGTVVKLSRRDHLLTIKNEAGTEVKFQLDAKTVADTATGLAQGFKYDLSKGEQVRVTSAQANGTDTALLIVPAA
ncbi:MAG: hypothetical protein M3O31_05680 [Acidobacteriota bacterium]|nr:hypothetical protein [Acidobacteriota bacterium]